MMTKPQKAAVQAESDPHGKDAHEPGAKLDAGKPRAGLVLGDFAAALLAVADVGTYGCRKYTASGWRAVPDAIPRYTDAMLRHWLEESRGVTYDESSELHHAAHVAWNALARLQLIIERDELPF